MLFSIFASYAIWNNVLAASSSKSLISNLPIFDLTSGLFVNSFLDKFSAIDLVLPCGMV